MGAEGAIYSTISIAFCLGSYTLGTLLVASFYEQPRFGARSDSQAASGQVAAHLTKSDVGSGKDLHMDPGCIGAHCFGPVFLVCSVLCVVGAGLSLSLVSRTKAAYRQCLANR